MGRIEDYSFGSISVDGQKFTADLIIYPDRIQSDWWRKEGHKLQRDDVAGVLAEPPEALIVGQGEPGKMQVCARLAEELDRMNVQLIAEPTRSACERFNELCQEGRRVVAALHLTC